MKSKNNMTRWDWVKYDTIRAALEINGGIKSHAAKFLGISVRTITDYFKRYPELKDYLCHRSKELSKGHNFTQRERAKMIVDPNLCHEGRPIGWVPQWYKDKYPSLFKD